MILIKTFEQKITCFFIQIFSFLILLSRIDCFFNSCDKKKTHKFNLVTSVQLFYVAVSE